MVTLSDIGVRVKSSELTPEKQSVEPSKYAGLMKYKGNVTEIYMYDGKGQMVDLNGMQVWEWLKLGLSLVPWLPC